MEELPACTERRVDRCCTGVELVACPTNVTSARGLYGAISASWVGEPAPDRRSSRTRSSGRVGVAVPSSRLSVALMTTVIVVRPA